MTEDEHTREVDAHSGLAVYIPQVLEHGIVNAMVATRLAGREQATQSEIDAFMNDQVELAVSLSLAPIGPASTRKDPVSIVDSSANRHGLDSTAPWVGRGLQFDADDVEDESLAVAGGP